MSKTYIWLDEEHTQVAEYIEPPQPIVITIVDLEAQIAELSQKVADAEAANPTEAQLLQTIKNHVAATTDLNGTLDFVTDEVNDKREADARIQSMTTRRDTLQALLDTINAEAT